MNAIIFKGTLNTYPMGLAQYLQEYEPDMIIVQFYLKRDLHKNVLKTEPFCRDIRELRYWKNNFNLF